MPVKQSKFLELSTIPCFHVEHVVRVIVFFSFELGEEFHKDTIQRSRAKSSFEISRILRICRSVPFFNCLCCGITNSLSSFLRMRCDPLCRLISKPSLTATFVRSEPLTSVGSFIRSLKELVL